MENILYLSFDYISFIIICIFYPSGAPILAQTLHRPEFAVVDYSFTRGVLCLH